MKLDDREVRVELGELLEPVERALGPRRRAPSRPSPRWSRASRTGPPRQRCHRAGRAPARARSRASGSSRKPRANESGGRPSRGVGSWPSPSRPSRRPREHDAMRRPRRLRPRPRRRKHDATRAAGLTADDSQATQRYSSESNGDISRTARTGEGGDRRDLHHRGARAPRVVGWLALRRRARAGRVGRGSHSRRDLHGPRTARAADRRAGARQEPRRSSSTAPPARARRSPRRCSRSSGT